MSVEETGRLFSAWRKRKSQNMLLLLQDVTADAGWKVFEKLNLGSCGRVGGSGGGGLSGSSATAVGFGGSQFSPDGGGTIGGKGLTWINQGILKGEVSLYH